MCLVFSPNGSLLAIGTRTGDVLIYELASGVLQASIRADGADINAIAFSPDGTLLATASGQLGGVLGNFVFRVYDLNADEFIFSLRNDDREQYPGIGTSVAFNPSGNFLAVGQTSGNIQYWDVSRREVMFVFEQHSTWVTSIDFDTDNSVLVSGGGGSGDVTLRDIQQGPVIATYHQDAWINVVRFDHDDTLLAIGGKTLVLWGVDARTPLATLDGHTTDGVLSAAFSPEGTLLASGGTDGTVRLWGVQR